MNNQETRYFIISPDGFPIERDAAYPTPKVAWAAFELWKKRFERQGYYSTVKGYERIRISLEELKDACELKEIKI